MPFQLVSVREEGPYCVGEGKGATPSIQSHRTPRTSLPGSGQRATKLLLLSQEGPPANE